MERGRTRYQPVGAPVEGIWYCEVRTMRILAMAAWLWVGLLFTADVGRVGGLFILYCWIFIMISS